MNMNTIQFDNGSKMFLSSSPDSESLDACMKELHDLNIHTIAVLLPKEDFLNIYENNLLEIYRTNNFRVLHHPIRNYDVPADLNVHNKIIESIIQQIQVKNNVLIHCLAGIGRTGLVAASVLIGIGRSVDYALTYVRSIRKDSVETKGQEMFLYQYFEYLKFRQNKIVYDIA